MVLGSQHREFFFVHTESRKFSHVFNIITLQFLVCIIMLFTDTSINLDDTVKYLPMNHRQNKHGWDILTQNLPEICFKIDQNEEYTSKLFNEVGVGT